MPARIRSSIRWKNFLQIIIVSVTIAAAVFYVGDREMRRETQQYYSEKAERLADSVAHNLKAAEVRELLNLVLPVYHEEADHEQGDHSIYEELTGNEEYQEIVDMLEQIRRSHKIHYAILMFPDLTEERLVYLADADAAVIRRDVNYRLPGESRAMHEGEAERFENWPRLVPAYSYYNRGNVTDLVWSAASAVVDENGNPLAYVMVDISGNEIEQASGIYLRRVLPVTALLTILLAALSVGSIGYSLVTPIKRISEAADHYVEHRQAGNGEQTSYFHELEIKTGGDEIERLANSLEKMERDLNSYIENVEAISSENSRIRTELSLANRIQADVLPSVFPPFPKRNDIGLYGTMNPAKEVGGDFYDFLLLDDTHLALVVADVSGKGVPAALFMMISKTLINNTVRGVQSPGKTLEMVNNMLCENNKMDLFVTCWLAVVDLTTGKMTYANAGHEDPLFFHRGRWHYITSKHGFVLAGIPGMKYYDFEEYLEPGDMVFQYTDGVTDCTNPAEELFGTKRLLDACLKARNDSAEDFLQDISETLRKFEGDAEQFDDITMLCFQYRP